MDIGELIKGIIALNLILYVFFIFFTTTIVYFTYRFWKLLLPKEEHNIFIANAPMVGYNQNIIDKNIGNYKLIEEYEIKGNIEDLYEKENLNTLNKKKEIKNKKNNTIISDIFSEKIIYLILFPLLSVILTIFILNNIK